jgi:acetyl esterase/lipase
MAIPSALHPLDLVMASTRAYSSLPVVGKHLEPFAGLTAMALYGHHYAPAALRGMVNRRFGPRPAEAAPVDVDPRPGRRMPPYLSFRAQRQRCLYRSSVRYGDHPAQLLDVWRRPDLPPDAPVLLFVPGGAWVQGSRVLQGHTMLHHLVKQGWVCLTMDYRVSPVHRWPRHVADVNAAVAWARANVDKFGGNRDFVAIAGCSAGGHLAALVGLTPGDAAFRGELAADADTSVDAVVGIYGRYDWEDRSTPERDRFVDFLERIVVRKRIARHPEVFRDASPIARVHRNAPPFLVIHGSKDSVIPVEQARSFVERLRDVSHSMVGYLELPGAGHGYDLIDAERAGAAAHAASLFLNQVYRTKVQIGAKEVI